MQTLKFQRNAARAESGALFADDPEKLIGGETRLLGVLLGERAAELNFVQSQEILHYRGDIRVVQLRRGQYPGLLFELGEMTICFVPSPGRYVRLKLIQQNL